MRLTYIITSSILYLILKIHSSRNFGSEGSGRTDEFQIMAAAKENVSRKSKWNTEVTLEGWLIKSSWRT